MAWHSNIKHGIRHYISLNTIRPKIYKYSLNHGRVHINNSHHRQYKQRGFTLIELIAVIVLLGIGSVGITSLIGLATQSYINVTDRDELIGNARFSVERLNREIRNALPNSVRTMTDSTVAPTIQCIEFVPIKASTIYTDIPVSPKPAADTLKAAKFHDEHNNDYQCATTCLDSVVVYPLNSNDVFANQFDATGKVFGLKSVTSVGDERTLTLDAVVSFENESPTNRLYIVAKPVSYCITAQRIYRYEKYDYTATQVVPPDPDPITAPDVKKALMAYDVAPLDINNLPFTVLNATLQRNALVQVKLNFTRNDENFVFNNEVHISNVP
ncbi:MAG: MSHA biogenesis protein MshO [Alteromonadaceae bacterium]|jgi:MSHA biogenesis protein MshO